MKLHEFVILLDNNEEPFDSMQSRDIEDSMLHPPEKMGCNQKHIPHRTPHKNSNVKKALRLKHAVQTLKRERSQMMTDEPKKEPLIKY